MLMSGSSNSPARALAKRVFPVPGAPEEEEAAGYADVAREAAGLPLHAELDKRDDGLLRGPQPADVSESNARFFRRNSRRALGSVSRNAVRKSS